MAGNTKHVHNVALSRLPGMESLGMTEGSKINVMRKKRNGAVIIKIRGTRFALGREIVMGIKVRDRAGKRDLS